MLVWNSLLVRAYDRRLSLPAALARMYLLDRFAMDEIHNFI
jgi:hypothetical protein